MRKNYVLMIVPLLWLSLDPAWSAEARIPESLSLTRSYPARIEDAFKGLAQAIRFYNEGKYDSALKQMPEQEVAKAVDKSITAKHSKEEPAEDYFRPCLR
jgi:hypothetical protein